MKIARTRDELESAVSSLRADGNAGRTIGLVPTMGALHDGHLSLVRASREQCPATIVSIFVNPTQFAVGEDLSSYPRPIGRDLEMLEAAGVDLVFLPDEATMYPPGCSTMVDPPAVARALEGAVRPAHFRGVATVVLKLLLLTGADAAIFGQKDYQQSLVVRHMVRDLNVPVQIVVSPIVRDDDGLALSSRNRYLDADQREIALSLNRALRGAASAIELGETDGDAVMAGMMQALLESGVDQVNYAVVADPETLELIEKVHPPVVLLVAARVGTTRLIDNLVIQARSASE